MLLGSSSNMKQPDTSNTNGDLGDFPDTVSENSSATVIDNVDAPKAASKVDPTATSGKKTNRSSLALMGKVDLSDSAKPRKPKRNSIFSNHSQESLKHDEEEEEENERVVARNMDPNKIEKDELATADAALTWKDIKFSVEVPDPDSVEKKPPKISKTILDNSCGHVDSGTLTALMGPSGCGKTTLLDILAGKKTAKYEGKVYVNGNERDGMFPRIMSYVGQADVMNQWWTVEEAVKFDFRLKKPVPAGLKGENVDGFVNTLLEDVGLLHVKDSRIGGPQVRGISGGQKRRVTLARGIAGKASIMFCDEPTSGLSATDAELCIKTLKGIVKRWNVTVLVVIHQPRIEVAELFDNLVLLTSRPGRIVYNGSMAAAAAYWARVGYPVPVGTNPTDHYLDTVTPGAAGAHPDEFVTFFSTNTLPAIMEVVDQKIAHKGKTSMEILNAERDMWTQFGWLPPISRSIHGTSWLTQYRMVLGRKLKLTFTDVPLLGLIFGTKLFVGCMIGAIYQGVGNKEPRGAQQVALFFILLQQVALQALVTMPPMFEERLIMKSETSEALYSVSAYVLSSSIIDSILCALANLMEVVIILAFSEIGMWDRVPEVLFWLTLLSLAMESIIIVVGAACKSLETAQNLAVPCLLIPIMYSGYLVNRNSCPEPWCAFIYAHPMHFVMEQVSSIFYGDDEVAWANLNQIYGHEKNDISLPLGYCLGFIIFFRAIHVWCLKKLNNIEK